MREVVGTVLGQGQEVVVRGVEPDGAPRWSFGATVLADDGDALTLRVRAGEPVGGLEPWAWPADGRLHLWRTRHYSILVTTRAERFPYWYCAIHTPAEIGDGEIRVADLGRDVQLFADGRYSVGGGTAASVDQSLAIAADAAVQELIGMMKRKAPPFGNAQGLEGLNVERP